MERMVLPPARYAYISYVRFQFLCPFAGNKSAASLQCLGCHAAYGICQTFRNGTRFPQYIEDVDRLGEELRKLGLVPDNTYLYMQGHHIMDCVVLKLLIPVCTVLSREREQEIKRLAEHSEQFRNELTGYENSQVNVSVMLKKNSGYKNLYL